MFSVIFEVQPKDAAHRDQYLAHARDLKPQLEQIDGFIDIERFARRDRESRMLSLSTWRDEKALIRWRTLEQHHDIQEKGRFEIFADYSLRVGEIISDSHVPPGQRLREQRFDQTEIGVAKIVTLDEYPPNAPGMSNEDARLERVSTFGILGLIEVGIFDSMYNPGKVLVLTAWRDEDARTGASHGANDASGLRRRTVRVVREYGMFDRREAPQYYRAIERS